MKRLILMIPTFIAILLVTYLITSALTGARVQEFSAYGDGDLLDEIFEKFDAPENRITKFTRYCFNLIAYGDMGKANTSTKIIDEVTFRIKYTLGLTALGFLLSILIGIPLGYVAALYRNRWPDRTVSFISAFLASIPSYCLALFLVIILCLWLKLFPVMGVETWKGFVIPTIVLGAGGVSITARMTRSEVLGILSKPYLTVLRAKGLPEWKILIEHVMKNAVTPILSVAGNIAVTVLCSTLVVENFFSVPGIGFYFVTAVEHREQIRILGSVVVVSLIIMVINFVSDILGALCNPKFRKQLKKKHGAHSRKGDAE